MARTREIYNAEDYIYEDSKREYDEVEILTNAIPDNAWGREDGFVRHTYYIDPATGLMVADIAAYEKWLNRG